MLRSTFALTSSQRRCISFSSALLNHYEVLGVSRTSTQQEIKSAYYELTKLYHPDKNKDNDEASEKFRAITEAYEVLGNVNLKRMYDKGLVSGFELNTPTVETDYEKFHRSRSTLKRPNVSGNQKLYDYDAWMRGHYSDVLQREKNKKKAKQSETTTKKILTSHHKLEVMLYVGIVFSLLGIISLSEGMWRSKPR